MELLLKESLVQHIISGLSAKLDLKLKLHSIAKLYGGSVNESYHFRFEEQSYFIKFNRNPALFHSEVFGLGLLGTRSNAIATTIWHGEFEGIGYLVLKYERNKIKSKDFWEVLANNISNIHRCTRSNFGLEKNNYIATIIQNNTEKENWENFFIENRLDYMQKLARSMGRIDSEISKKFDKLYAKIEGFFPEEKPSLVHGDLWIENVVSSFEGLPVLIDPAVYYGHREMDLSMSLLFGGFDKRFYEVYTHFYPLEKEWEQRIDICNLYPLLIHVVLFGANYSKRVSNILKRYV